jgi:outer membrane protein assembly factor BamB
VPTEDGSLYVGSLASQLEKFDTATGNHQAVVDAANWVWSSPSLDGDTLYFGDVNGNLYSYNTSTGDQNWKAIKPDNSDTASITASPLVQEQHVLVATESGSVFAVDRDGKILWNETIGGKIYTSPIAAGELTIVAPLETDFYLVALDSNGRQIWTFTPEN